MSEQSATSSVPNDRPDATRQMAGVSGDPATPSKAKKPSTKEREQQARVERLAHFVATLEAAAHEKFADVLDQLVKGLRNTLHRRKQLRELLAEAMARAPADFSGARIVKHYKEGSDWNPSDVVCALNDLTQVVARRSAEVERLGIFMQGALIPLVSACEAIRPKAAAHSDDDYVGALVALHRSLYQEARPPLAGDQGLSEGRPFPAARDFLKRFLDRSDVQAIMGQRLFGFELCFLEKQPATSTNVDPAIASDVLLPILPTEPPQATQPAVLRHPAEAKGESDERVQKSSPTRDRVKELSEQLLRKARELSDSERLLDRSQKAGAALRTAAADDAKKLILLAQSLHAARSICEAQSVRLQEQDELLEGAATIRAQLAESQAKIDLLGLRVAELETALRQAVAQNASAKTTEFQRGCDVTKAQIGAYCVERLHGVRALAEALDGEQAVFIASVAKSLARYLET